MLDTAKTPVSTTIYRKDYLPPDYLIQSVELDFELEEAQTVVRNRMRVVRNNQAETQTHELKLDGDELELKQIRLNGSVLDDQQYSLDDAGLTVADVPDQFELELTSVIYPQTNTKLMGLYKSAGIFCTQCEAQGFRRITYFPDRPDVLSTYTVTLHADKKKYPVLLSNGNRMQSGESDGGKHWARWHDPFPKPSYLFALVAGDLAKITDSFQTLSGRKVTLEIYSEPHNIEQCDFALESLKKAMRWDEQAYGLEYDLDIYMIVAVDDFNMGAMENKGLNIFNTKYVLADSKTATDNDFLGVESVIAHEYFHNWSGNRVTCRDWFQLSLKEGFTVYRDQQFSADMHSHGVKRVEDVNVLRAYQFREDAGPMAHPVRPESYQEINNFYTLTVYNKGAEVVRMLSTIVGKTGFGKGCDLYFKCHDGQAVTIEEFVKAMEDANDIDLEQFRRWYSQAGTPVLDVVESYNPDQLQFTLKIKQYCPLTPGQKKKLPFHIPIKIGLLSESGVELKLVSSDTGVEVDESSCNAVLNLTGEEQRFVFARVSEKPICSFLRGFSAPVDVKYNQPESQLSVLMAADSDAFNRFDAAQRLMKNELLRLIGVVKKSGGLSLGDELIQAVAKILLGNINDPALTALALTPPGEIYLSGQVAVIDPGAIHQAREFLIRELAIQHRDHWLNLYQKLSSSDSYVFDQTSIGRRSLRQCCLDYLVNIDEPDSWQLAHRQYESANNMTERIGAFKAFLHTHSPGRQAMIDDFYEQFNQHALVMDKWLSVQATVPRPDTLHKVRKLEQKRIFDRKNPNKLRSLVGAFVSQNPVCFHASDGSGYAYLSDWLRELDPVNPQVAARLAGSFSNWRRYDKDRQQMMKHQLQKLNTITALSRDLKEIVSKALDS